MGEVAIPDVLLVQLARHLYWLVVAAKYQRGLAASTNSLRIA